MRDEFFPPVEQIAARMAAGAAEPAEWKEANLRMVEEFLAKAEALGLKSGLDGNWWYLSVPFLDNPSGSSGSRYQSIWCYALDPGPPPHWHVPGGEETEYALAEVPHLEHINPADLQAQLDRLLPRPA